MNGVLWVGEVMRMMSVAGRKRNEYGWFPVGRRGNEYDECSWEEEG